MTRAALTCFFSATLLSACALGTAGVKPGDERNFVRSMRDINAGRAVKARMVRAHDFDLNGVDVEVAQGIVVLTGHAPSPKDRIEAERIAWSAPAITEVGNEIVVREAKGIIRETKDGVLKTAVRTRLTAAGDVKGRNFNIETHDGVVYLLGVARTPEELERAAQIAANTSGAREVISYVTLADGVLPSSKIGVPVTAPVGGDYLQPHIDQPAAQAPPSQDVPPVLQSAPTAPVQITPLPPVPRPPTQESPYRTGQPGDVVSEEESAPYYIDPESGKMIPVRYVNGRVEVVSD